MSNKFCEIENLYNKKILKIINTIIKRKNIYNERGINR